MDRCDWIAVFFTIVIWGAIPSIAKFALLELDSYQLVFITNALVPLTLFFILGFQRNLRLLCSYGFKDHLRFAGFSFIGTYLYMLTRYASFEHAPVGQAQILNYLWPAFLVLFSVLILKEPFHSRTFFSLALSFLGAMLVVTRGSFSFSHEYLLGYGLAILGALFYGFFSVLEKRQKYEKYSSTFWYFFYATLFMLPTLPLLSSYQLPATFAAWAALLFLGVLANALGYVFWFQAVQKGHTPKLANLVYLVPFLSLVFAYFINGEAITLPSFFGLLLIVGGILMQKSRKLA
ncbi:MAG: DMT family transporter [Nanoarchaeota archaeon]|nr:DMT family transporter [Nanoarchaeota archaeon]